MRRHGKRYGCSLGNEALFHSIRLTMKPTNVTRLLDAHQVDYHVQELPKRKLSAKETAELLDIPESDVCKTIVATRKSGGKPILVVVPGDKEVDLKSLARVLGEKKVGIATQKNAESLTGLKAGGISPLALIKRGFQVVIDSSVEDKDYISVSAGKWGLCLSLPPASLAELTCAQFAPVCTS